MGVCFIKTSPTHDFIEMNLTAAMMTRRFWNMLCYALDKHHQSSAARRSMIKVKPVSCNLRWLRILKLFFPTFSHISDEKRLYWASIVRGKLHKPWYHILVNAYKSFQVTAFCINLTDYSIRIGKFQHWEGSRLDYRIDIKFDNSTIFDTSDYFRNW